MVQPASLPAAESSAAASSPAEAAASGTLAGVTPDGAERPAKKLKSLSGLLPFLRPYRLQVGLALLFLALAAGATLVIPAALKDLIDQGFNVKDLTQREAAIRAEFMALFGVAVVLGIFTAARFYMVSWLGERVTADLRNAVYAHVLEQSPQFFETTQTGEVLSRLTADTTLVQTVVGSSFSLGLRNTVLFVGGLVMLLVTNPYVMGMLMLILALIVLPAVVIGRRVRKLSRASQDRVADSSAIAAEVLNAIPVVQGYTQERREAERFAAASENAFRTAIKRNRTRAVLTAFIIITIFGALLYGVYEGTQAVMKGSISAGHLGQTVLYVTIVASSVGVLAEVFGDMLRAAGATERLIELLNLKSPVEQPADAKPLPAAPLGAATSARRGLAVRFDHVRFSYPSRPQQAALDGVDLEVQPGETLALVGPSGAGKSTMIQLLLRFYDVAGGEIRLNGLPIRQADLGSLRAAIAYVPQESTLFSASALDNIRYGRPDASDDEVIAAARAAYADDFIRALPEGYNSFLGERGVRLSGGQRQRIAIARAMLKNAPLLLLDEATSALDAESERYVQQALEHAMQDRTTLVIAHRLATVQRADRIVVMDRGRIVETGRHEQLVAQGGLYARLAELQFL
jgi:ATP-binding cassette subfamily B protein